MYSIIYDIPSMSREMLIEFIEQLEITSKIAKSYLENI